jgi:hypothetical protein
MQIGIDSFVEVSLDSLNGGARVEAQRIRDLLAD